MFMRAFILRRMGLVASGQSEAMLLVLSENCVPWSFIGYPAISLPCGAAPGNLPVGLEIVAAPHHDRLLLAVASAYEAVAAVRYV